MRSLTPQTGKREKKRPVDPSGFDQAEKAGKLAADVEGELYGLRRRCVRAPASFVAEGEKKDAVGDQKVETVRVGTAGGPPSRDDVQGKMTTRATTKNALSRRDGDQNTGDAKKRIKVEAQAQAQTKQSRGNGNGRGGGGRRGRGGREAGADHSGANSLGAKLDKVDDEAKEYEEDETGQAESTAHSTNDSQIKERDSTELDGDEGTHPVTTAITLVTEAIIRMDHQCQQSFLDRLAAFVGADGNSQQGESMDAVVGQQQTKNVVGSDGTQDNEQQTTNRAMGSRSTRKRLVDPDETEDEAEAKKVKKSERSKKSKDQAASRGQHQGQDPTVGTTQQARQAQKAPCATTNQQQNMIADEPDLDEPLPQGLLPPNNLNNRTTKLMNQALRTSFLTNGTEVAIEDGGEEAQLRARTNGDRTPNSLDRAMRDTPDDEKSAEEIAYQEAFARLMRGEIMNEPGWYTY